MAIESQIYIFHPLSFRTERSVVKNHLYTFQSQMFRKLNMTKTGKIESIIHTFYAKQSQF